MAGFVLSRLPETDEELWLAVQALWGFKIPRTKVCADHSTPFDAFADAYFHKTGSIAVWKGSRGLAGKSVTLAILGLTKAALLGCDINLLGGSLAQSTNIHEHMRLAWEYKDAPKYMIESESSLLIKLTNHAKIRPLTASQRTVRGPHPPFLLLDEIDEMDEAIMDAALGQPLPQKNYLGDIVDTYTVMSSTWQYPDKTMAHALQRAEERGWPIYEWCWRETSNPIDGWLSPQSVERKRSEISNEMWRVEYDLGEPSIGSRAFDPDAVEAMFSLPLDMATQLKAEKDHEEWEFEAPISGARYVAGADWGKEKDYTVISVFRADTKPRKLVYYLRANRRPYPMMIDWFNKIINKYNAAASHDATGLGNVVNDYVDMRANKFLMTGEKRANMLSEYVAAVERGEYVAPQVKTAYLAHKYCAVEDLYRTGETFHLPDEVCSMALAHHMVKRMIGDGSPVVIGKDRTPRKVEQQFIPQHHQDEPVQTGEVIIKDPRPGAGAMTFTV